MKFYSQSFALAAVAAFALSSAAYADGGKGMMGEQQSMQQSEVKKEDLKKESVKFDSGKAELNKDAKGKLSKLVKDAQKEGRIDHLTVVAWADTAYPPKGMQQQQQERQQEEAGMTEEGQQSAAQMPQPVQGASQADQDLAKKRAEAISNYLKSDLKVTAEVKTIVMGKDHADWFSNAFNAEESELQSQFARQGETPVNHAEFQLIKDQAKERVGLVILTPSMSTQQSESPEGITPEATTEEGVPSESSAE